MSGSPVENEIKLRLQGQDTREILERLRAAGFEICAARVFESNSVYDTSDKDLKAKGQMLRLRTAGETVTLTWKGEEVPGRHKNRPEIEMQVSDAAACNHLLFALGYTLVFRYEKYRTELKVSSGGGKAMLDETPIGLFLELEGNEGWVDETAARLGFTERDYITASYGSLYRSHRGKHLDAPENMVFPLR